MDAWPVLSCALDLLYHTKATVNKKSSHARLAFIMRLAWTRNITATIANTIRIVASAYIFPGDSPTARTEDMA